MAAPDTIVQAQGLNSVKSGSILVTPTGGAQGMLADLLKSGQGTSGPVAATTLSASSTVTLSPTGTVTVNPSVAGAMDNMAIGVTTPLPVHATTLSATGLVALTGAPSIGSVPPANAAAAGVTGTVTWASGFLYVCVATNTWQRAAIATW